MRMRTDLPHYNRFTDIKRLDFVAKELAKAIPPKGSVLDVGCGNGIISLQLGNLGYDVHGIDMSEKSIENARKNNRFNNVSFSVMDVETLKATGKRFDAIICSEVLEHLQEPGRLVKELHSVLSDQGILIVTVPNGKGPRECLVTKPFLKLRSKNNFLWHLIVGTKKVLGYSGTTVQSANDNLDHIQFFSKKDLLALSKENGFRIDCIKSSNFIDDIFPISLITKKSMALQRADAKVADLLPTSFTGGYLMVWKKA